MAFQPLVRGFVRAIALSTSLMMRFRLLLALEPPQRSLLSAASLRRAAGGSGSAPARIIARGRAHQALHVGLDQPETDITVKFLPTLV